MSHTTKNINKCPKENKTIRVRKRKLKVRKGEKERDSLLNDVISINEGRSL